ncbi:hypothetical protein GCM10028810_71970 [Spirosoma litoris]
MYDGNELGVVIDIRPLAQTNELLGINFASANKISVTLATLILLHLINYEKDLFYRFSFSINPV